METIQLKKGQTYFSQQACSLKVQAGQVWVTIEGDEEDYVLIEGQSMPTKQNQRLLLQGLEQALVLFDTE